MFSKPKMPTPIPPALPATAPAAAPGASPFAKLANQVGIFTSTSGITTPASTQKRSLIGG